MFLHFEAEFIYLIDNFPPTHDPLLPSTLQSQNNKTSQALAHNPASAKWHLRARYMNMWGKEQFSENSFRYATFVPNYSENQCS